MPYFEKGGRRILFVHIPKTGGTSVEEFLKKNHWKEYKRKPPGIYNMHSTPDIWENWGNFEYIFTVVREPIERLESEFGGWLVNEHQNLLLSMMNGHTVRTDFLKQIFNENKIHPEKFYSKYGNHIRPQVDFITKDVDIYYFPEGLKKLRQKLIENFDCNKNISLPHHKKGVFKPVFNEEQIILIKEYYKKDYETFFKEQK